MITWRFWSYQQTLDLVSNSFRQQTLQPITPIGEKTNNKPVNSVVGIKNIWLNLLKVKLKTKNGKN
jgi:hypothetical protein